MSRRPSTQSNRFDATATADIPRSSFDLSHGLKTTFSADDLVPILNLEILPGDSISCRASIFGRMATPLKPLLDNLHCETFFFFTPTRQVFTNWVKMHGEQENPDDSIDFATPVLTGLTISEGSIFDYYGLPTAAPPSSLLVNAIPFRIYNHIYNNWFRDQNLIDSIPVLKTDGPDPATNYVLRKRRKKKDYFTGCLPWPQKFQDVTVNLGGSAAVYNESGTGGYVQILDGPGATNMRVLLKDGAGSNVTLGSSTAGNPPELLYADLSAATGISINDLRESIQIQRLLERDARGGTRYPEMLRSHFGVSDPMMLVHQRPVFLGGGHTMINISPIAQSSGTGGAATPYTNTPQGNLAAVGIIAANNHGFTYSATEHGFITGIINVRADLTYQQGLERYWSRRTRFDYFYPALGHLGEMAVLGKELKAGTAEDELVFGYQEAWADYRYVPSKITGLFRSNAAESLDVWHLAQDFASSPLLNQSFIESNTPMDRVVAVPTEPDFLLDVYFKIKAARPLPLYGTPGMLDHF